MNRFQRLLTLLLLAFAAALPARAASVIPLYLEEIVGHSTVAFEGTCLENRAERDELTGYAVTYTTFAVHDVLKGSVGTRHTIKQIGGESAPGEPTFRVQGVPSFTVGERYVVFLAGVSAAGFSSPIGLAQGRFRVVSEAGGPQVTNDRDFREMLARVQPDALPARAKSRLEATPNPVRTMHLEDFKALVRRQAGPAK